MTDSKKAVGKSVRQLLVIAALMVIGYICIRALRITVDVLNLICHCVVYAIPLLAIRPVLRLHRRPRIWGLVLLSPLLLLSSLYLLGAVVFDGLLGPSERSEEPGDLLGFGQLGLLQHDPAKEVGKELIVLRVYGSVPEILGRLGNGVFFERIRGIVP